MSRSASVVESDFDYDSALVQAPLRDALFDLYRHRGLIRLLVERDLTVRYKRSVLGITWTVINPLLTAGVMWLVFSHLFHAQLSGSVPYIVYVLAGLLVVGFFQQGVATTAASLAASAGALKQLYVPPVVFAFAAACGGAVNFVFGLVALIIFQLALGPGIVWTIVAVPLPLLALLAMIAGLGFLLASFVIRFDDVLNLVTVFLMLLAYVTPTFYPISIIPPHYRDLFYLNPLYAYLNVFRYLEYGGPRPALICIPIIVISAVVSFGVGAVVFVRRWPSLAVFL